MSTAYAHPGLGELPLEDGRERSVPGTVYMAGGLLVAYLLVNEANIRTGGSYDWQDMLRVLVCVACGVFGFFSLPHTARHFLRFPAAWCTLFGIWALLTIPFAGNSLFGAVSCVTLWTTLLFAPAALHHLGARRFVDVTAATLLLVLAGSWITVFFFPALAFRDSLGDTSRLAGLNHPNTTAGQATLLLGLMLCLRVGCGTPWRKLLVPIALALATLALTLSRTNLVTATAVVALLLAGRERFVYVAMIVVALAAGFALLIGLGVSDWESQLTNLTRSGDVGEIYNLGGRAFRWSHILDLIYASPLMGYGHGCARYSAEGHAHSLWLNITLTTGLIGLGCVVGMMVPLGYRLVTTPNPFPDLLILYVFMRGLTTSPLFNPIPGGTSLLFVCALFWRLMGMSLQDESNPDEGAR